MLKAQLVFRYELVCICIVFSGSAVLPDPVCFFVTSNFVTSNFLVSFAVKSVGRVPVRQMYTYNTVSTELLPIAELQVVRSCDVLFIICRFPLLLWVGTCLSPSLLFPSLPHPPVLASLTRWSSRSSCNTAPRRG